MSLLGALHRAGIGAAGIEEGIALFKECHKGRLRFDEIQRRIQELKEQRKRLLGDQTKVALAKRKEDLQIQQAAILAEAPELSGAATENSLHELESWDEQLAHDLAEAEQEAARLSAAIETTLGGHRARCEVEEDLARYDNEVRSLERFASALRVANDVLQEATEEVHRDFAPRLAHSLGQSLSRVTQGRYRLAYVDPSDFSIGVGAPETRDVVHIGQLSIGTQEQAYLLLRIELARMLSASGETLPIIMDDPFVNFDDKRLQNTLELLTEISKENQLLLFTKDAFISQWLQCNCEEDAAFTVHQLPAPSCGR